MKYWLPKIFFLITTTSFSSAIAQTKHALVFAIGNYPEEKGWAAISSLTDAKALNTVLTNQGFNDIRIYRDSQVTSAGIAKAFNDLMADKKLAEGDVVVIHVSSHGSQVEDDDEDETDGLDESIVTYDAVSMRKGDKKNYTEIQKNYFRDDQFGEYIRQLRVRLGKNGDVIVFMDACHSGTGTRGTAKIRGGEEPVVSEKFKLKTVNADSKTKNVFRDKNTSDDDEKKLAAYTVISAARPDELNYEAKGKNMGSLSYAISKVFEKLEPGTTYRSLFTKIQAVMMEVTPITQHPVMESNASDRELFGGKFIAQKPYVQIATIKGTQLTVNAGVFAGLDKEAKVALYPANTKDPSDKLPLATGIVTGASDFTATVTLIKNPGILKPSEGLIFITQPVYNIAPLKIGFSSGLTSRGSNTVFSETEMNEIKGMFKTMPGTVFDNDPEIVISKNPANDSIFIKIAASGYSFNKININDTAVQRIKESIVRYTRYKFLRDIEIKDADAQVDVKLVPYMNGKPDTTAIENKIVQGIYEFNEGDKIALWIKNKSKRAVYVNILDMQPDGKINSIFPNSKKTIMPADLKIAAGSTVLYQQYPITLYPPYGMEIFKVFVAPEMINMEMIAPSNDAGTRGNFKGLSKLVSDSYSVASRGGGEVQNLDNTSGSTFNLLFRIKKKQ